ncbi:hypothetical protein [Streptomyces sp. NPDC094049]|uniref:hypothetical protein n=1 Tax=Streptomyces sp. NPDC094049 TaxID=3154987 RepID=UPI00332444B9
MFGSVRTTGRARTTGSGWTTAGGRVGRVAAGLAVAGLALWGGQTGASAAPGPVAVPGPAAGAVPVGAEAETFVLGTVGKTTLTVPRTVAPGESLDVLASFTNTYDYTVPSATLTISFPSPQNAKIDVNDSSYIDGGEGYTYGGSPAVFDSESVFQITWAAVPPGATATTQVGMTVRTGTSGPLTIGGRAASTGVNPVDIGQGTVDITPPVPAAADLGVTLAASPHGLGSVNAAFTATVTNNGPATAHAKLNFTYSPGFRLPTATGCTTDATTRTASCDLGPLANGAGVTRTLDLTAGLLTIGLPLPVTAALSDITPADPVPGNNTAVRSCAAVTALLLIC